MSNASTRRSRLSRLGLLVSLIAMMSTSCQWIIRTGFDVSGAPLTADTDSFDVSNDGRFVVFATAAPGFAGDTNGFSDIMLRDNTAGLTTIITNYNGASREPVISGDGSKVAYASAASDIVPGDTNGVWDIFVYDTNNGSTTRITEKASGVQANGDSRFPDISDDGSVIAFESSAGNLHVTDNNGLPDIFVSNGGDPMLVSRNFGGFVSNGVNRRVTVSGDGTAVAWESEASNLVPPDNNGVGDIFKVDLDPISVPAIVSTSAAGVRANAVSGAPSINRDGSAVAFFSNASNLIAGDTNNQRDVFVKTGTQVERVSVTTAGDQFTAYSTNPSISADGSRVAMVAYAANLGLPPGDLAVVRDRVAQRTDNVSRDTANSIVGNVWGEPVISGDGRYVGFRSDTALVDDDTNGLIDVHLASYPEPKVGSITPSVFPRGQTTTFTIDGSRFESPTLKNTAGVTYQVLGTTPTQITAQVTVDNTASTGDRSIRVTNQGTGPGINTGSDHFCLNCITIS